MKRFKENGKRQNASDSQAGQNVGKEPTALEQQGPDITTVGEQEEPKRAMAFAQQRLTTAEATELHGVSAPTAFEHQGPNMATAFEQQGPDIATAFQQQDLTVAGATELRGVNAPTDLEEKGTNITAAVNQQGPIASTVGELQGVPMEPLDPDEVAEMIERHEISLKRFDSIFEQVGIYIFSFFNFNFPLV